MLRECESFCVIEFHIQLGGDDLGEQCAAQQRAAHRRGVMLRKSPGKFDGEALYRTRSEKQQIKVKPQIAVIAGFEFEMSPAGGQQTCEFLPY